MIKYILLLYRGDFATARIRDFIAGQLHFYSNLSTRYLNAAMKKDNLVEARTERSIEVVLHENGYNILATLNLLNTLPPLSNKATIQKMKSALDRVHRENKISIQNLQLHHFYHTA